VFAKLPAALGSHLILVAFFFTFNQMTFPKMGQINPVDKSAHGSDLGLTFLPPIFVLVTLPAALGSHLILVALVYYS